MEGGGFAHSVTPQQGHHFPLADVQLHSEQYLALTVGGFQSVNFKHRLIHQFLGLLSITLWIWFMKLPIFRLKHTQSGYLAIDF